MDLITQLQAEINNVGMLFYDSVGTLQGQATSVSVAGEDVIQRPSGSAAAAAGTSGDGAGKFNVQDASQSFASRLTDSFRCIETLTAKLPAVPRGAVEEEQQMQRIRQLQKRDAELALELQQLTQLAEARLYCVQHIYAAVAQHELHQVPGTAS